MPGVGHDIDFVSLYGYDPAPHDLPSLYFSLEALQTALGSSYRGVAVNHGADTITNSIVLPETEDRSIDAIGGTAPLILGINGLFAANIGSHIGLPICWTQKPAQAVLAGSD